MGIKFQFLTATMLVQLAWLTVVVTAVHQPQVNPVLTVNETSLKYLGDTNGTSFYLDESQQMNWADSNAYCQSFDLTAATVTNGYEFHFLFFKVPDGLWSSEHYPLWRICGLTVKVSLGGMFYGFKTERRLCNTLGYILCSKPVETEP